MMDSQNKGNNQNLFLCVWMHVCIHMYVCVSGWMDGWWMDEWMMDDGWMDNGWMEGWMDDGLMNGWWMDEWMMERWMGWMDGCICMYMYVYTHTQTHTYITVVQPFDWTHSYQDDKVFHHWRFRFRSSDQQDTAVCHSCLAADRSDQLDTSSIRLKMIKRQSNMFIMFNAK